MDIAPINRTWQEGKKYRGYKGSLFREFTIISKCDTEDGRIGFMRWK